jgi:hypothetical protein
LFLLNEPARSVKHSLRSLDGPCSPASRPLLVFTPVRRLGPRSPSYRSRPRRYFRNRTLL